MHLVTVSDTYIDINNKDAIDWVTLEAAFGKITWHTNDYVDDGHALAIDVLNKYADKGSKGRRNARYALCIAN